MGRRPATRPSVTLEPPSPSFPFPLAALTLGSPVLWWTLSLAALAFVLAAVEAGWTRLSRTRLAETGLGPAARSRVEKMLAEGDRVEDALIVLRVATQVLLVVLLVLLFRQAFDLTDEGGWAVLGVSLAGGAAFLWITLFCRVLPDEMSASRLESLVRTTMPLVVLLSRVLSPPIELMRKLARRVTGHTRQADKELYTDEILSTLEEGEREGHLEGAQADMIERILELHDTEVRELMTPRTDMDTIDIGASVAEAQQVVRRTGRSRYPLVEGTVDKVVGVLHAKDLLGQEDAAPVADIAREPWFVPESKYCTELLAEFRRERAHLAVVLDEYGGSAGLVTIEDVLEEIVGEIADEFDETKLEPELTILDEHHALARGAIHVDELNEELSVSIPESDDWSTLGGFIFSTLGRLPKEGEELRHGNLLLRVEQVVDRRIERVAIEILEVAA